MAYDVLAYMTVGTFRAEITPIILCRKSVKDLVAKLYNG